jgi:hypothetical protein
MICSKCANKIQYEKVIKDTTVEEIIDDTSNSKKVISMASAPIFAYC